MRKSWKRLLAATTLVGLIATAGCSSDSGDSGDGSSDTLLVYNAQHESLTKQWIDAFTKETGIKVEYRQGGDTDLGNQIVAEGDKSPADVFLTENSPAMTLVENAGLFADVAQDTLNQVPQQYRPSSDKWTGVAARTTVFVYNKDKLPVDQLPKSMTDLQQPEWKGRWGAAPSGADFQAIVAAYLELKGEDATRAWLAGMKTNATAYKNNIATMKAVNAGEVPGGIIYHYYWFADQANTKEDSGNTELYYFRNQDPGAYVSVSGGGVLKSSKKQEQAQKFLQFITGKGGQEVLHTGTAYEYTVASGVPSNDKLVPLDQLQAPVVDSSKLQSKKVTDLMTEAGLL